MSIIRYKVTVTAVTERREISGGQWTVVDKVPISEDSDKLKEVYGYTPEIEKTVRAESQIYEQTVEQLDMASLVSVVNGLKGG
jgi:hypothetical protein